MNLAEALNTIALLLPGYAGAWAMSFIMGIRKREWSQVILYSLLFSAISYFIVLRFSPFVTKWEWLDLSGYQLAANQISNLGNKAYIIEFHNVIKVALSSMILCLILGIVAGLVRRSIIVRSAFIMLARRTQHADIWNDFHEEAVVSPHTVLLRDGSAYYGPIVMSSDTLTGNDRGVTIQSPIVLKDYQKHLWNNKQVNEMEKYIVVGKVLIFSDQIAAIYGNDEPFWVDRYKKERQDRLDKTIWRRVWKWIKFW